MYRSIKSSTQLLDKISNERVLNGKSISNDFDFYGFEFGPEHLKRKKDFVYEGGNKDGQDEAEKPKKKRGCCGKDTSSKYGLNQYDWERATEEERKKRIEELWKKARDKYKEIAKQMRYEKKLKEQQKNAVIDDVDEDIDAEDEMMHED